ncbi:IS66 family insertion sequence element accessory protein TnpB (plasmid) [Sinorhizobium numidicum]|uniref:IS66 family insertion sequence element accessory protein TnpB n=1 Tax=Sinorhizobium numidicum TaxID=680248 RepID=A0ABY8D382_9HYPH|nr:IS66 family insertion sequence element accessory protein TnpB [Sinorhizobium numidicum]WEX79285.1 IS66 family insertion sequence element accessory protein TnpB [Sinorhizobium numidicum]WEX85344.1 IS66 family insertion sequence element accessory protein TnpB [Sinorhizobium numidicum]
MIVAGQGLPIVIATRPVDFRCGHQALALMVQTELKLDPHSGVTVIFRSKHGCRLKILPRMERCDFLGLNTKPFDGLDWRRFMAQRVTAPTAAG